MTTYTWIGGAGDWAEAANWGPPGGPPTFADTAQVFQPSTLSGSGIAGELDTSNASGLVTLAGGFNVGTIFNGAEMALSGDITSNFIETFVNLDITGEITANATSGATFGGIAQYNGTVTIDNRGSVDASQYLISYNPGSIDQPNVNTMTIDGADGGAGGGAWLTIATDATADASNQVSGGFAIVTAAAVKVENNATLATTYLALQDAGASLVVSGAATYVTQTSSEPNGIAGTSIDGGSLEIENKGTFASTFFFQGGNAGSQFIVDDSTVDINTPTDGFNGFEIHDGNVTFRNEASVTATQLFLGSPMDTDDEPSLSIMSSSLDVTGTFDITGLADGDGSDDDTVTKQRFDSPGDGGGDGDGDGDPTGFSFGGIWLFGGTTTIGDQSSVTTPSLEIDSPPAADPATVLGDSVTIEGGAALTVAGNALLAVTPGASVQLIVSGLFTELRFGQALIIGDGTGTIDAADAFIDAGTVAVASLLIDDSANVIGTSLAGSIVAGEDKDSDGYIDVNGDESSLTAQAAFIGDSGMGTLVAHAGATIGIAGELVLGANASGIGVLGLAEDDGAGMVTAGTLVVGNDGTSEVFFTSEDSSFSGTLVVTGDAYVGASGGGGGTIIAHGGSFGVGGDVFVGGAGSGDVSLDASDLSVGGDLVVGNGGPDAILTLLNVTAAIQGTVAVGQDGSGFLDWGSTSEQSTALDTVIAGDDADGDGQIVVHDPTTFLTMGTLVVGNQGTGELDLFNGATVEVLDEAVIGAFANSSGTIDLETGSDSTTHAPYGNPDSDLVVDHDLIVGQEGDGDLTVGGADGASDSGLVNVDGDLIVGDSASANGFVQIANVSTAGPSLLDVGGDIEVGAEATGGDNSSGTFEPGGFLWLQSGATVTATGTATADSGVVDAGVGPAGTGSIEVDSATLLANTLIAGDGGDGVAVINGGSVMVSGDIIVGNSADATGEIDVENGGTLRSSGDLVVGGASTAIVSAGSVDYPAILDVETGATVVSNGTGNHAFIVGADTHSLGEALFDAATLQAGLTDIGLDGSGALELNDASTAAFSDDLLLGVDASGFGGLSIDNSDAEFSGGLDVGENATGATIGGAFIAGGILTVEDGASLVEQGPAGIDIGAGAGGSGQMLVDDSTVQAASVTIGVHGSGALTVQNNATLLVDPEATTEIGAGVGSAGTLTVDGGALSFGSELDVGDEGNGAVAILNQATVTPDGTAPDTDVFIGGGADVAGSILVDDALFKTDNITVGDEGTGGLTIQNGGTVNAGADSDVNVGATAGASGSILVDGGLLETAGITIGVDGTGRLTIQNGGTVDTSGDADIASQASVLGFADLVGMGGGAGDTFWKIGGDLTVGDLGAGTIALSAGATLTAGGAFDLGGSAEAVGATGTGVVLASDPNTVIEADGALDVGVAGKGTIALSALAALTANGDVTIGDGINASGSLLVSNAIFAGNGGEVTIGEQGSGDVEVNGGGEFNAGSSDVVLGGTGLGKGKLNLTGNGGGPATAATGDLTIGEAGSGSLSVHGGGQLTTNGDAVIGDTGTGNVLIEGTGAAASTWLIDGGLSVGGIAAAGGGVGTLTVANNGIAQVTGALTLWNQGTIIDNGGSAGLIEIGGTTLTSGRGVVIDAATTAAAAGTLTGGGTIEANVLDNGQIEVANRQTLTITGNVDGSGTMALDGSSALLLKGSVASTVSIDFDNPGGDGEVLALSNPLVVAGTIDGMGAGDAIDLAAVPFAGTGFSVTGDVLTVTNGGGTVAALSLGGGSYTTAQFSLAQDGSGHAEIVFGARPETGTPVLYAPASVTGWAPNSIGQLPLDGPNGVFLTDPNPPVFANYTVTFTAQLGQFEFGFQSDLSQYDHGPVPSVTLSGSLARINSELIYLGYVESGDFLDAHSPPDTIDVSLTRGDGTTVTQAIAVQPVTAAPSIRYTGPTTVALGRAIPLNFAFSDPLFVNTEGGDHLFWGVSSDGTGTILLSSMSTGASYGGGAGAGLSGSASSDVLDAALDAGDLTYVPNVEGENTLTVNFTDPAQQFISQTFTIDVTPETEASPATDTWIGAASTSLGTGGNWNLGNPPSTIDTAVFAPIAGVPVLATTGNGVAAAWDVDAAASFTGIIDATGSSGGPAFDVDQGATAYFLDQSGLVADGALIVGDTAASTLIYRQSDQAGNLGNSYNGTGNLETGDTTIANRSGAAGSEAIVSAADWYNSGSVTAGGAGFGVLDLFDADLQVANGLRIGAGNGVLGVVASLYSGIDGTVQVGAGGNGELVLGGGGSLVEGNAGESADDGATVLAISGGSRVDLAAGELIGLGPNQTLFIDYGGVLSGDGTIERYSGPPTTSAGTVLINGTVEAVHAGDPLLIAANIYGGGTLEIDAGATLALGVLGTIDAGPGVTFLPAFNGTGGTFSIAAGATVAAIISGFGAGDRIAFGTSGLFVQSADHDAAADTTNVVFGPGSTGPTLSFAGSLTVGDFVLNPDQPAGETVFDATDPSTTDQPLVLSGPTDIATTDGVATPIPGLSLSDADAGGAGQLVTLTISAANGGVFSAVDSTGAAVNGNGGGTITVSGPLAAVQGDLAAITFTPATGTDDTITIDAATHSGATPATITIFSHDSSSDDPDFAATNTYFYAGPSATAFDLAGSWQDASGSAYASAPGVADSAIIDANPADGVEDVLGGFALAGQLLTMGAVVLTGTMDLPGLVGAVFSGALEAGPGVLILGAGSGLTAGGDVVVDGELDALSDNDSTIAGNILISGGAMRLGGLGTVTTAGTVEISAAGELDLASGTLVSASGTIGATAVAGTSVVDVGAGKWALSGVLAVGGMGDGLLALEDRTGFTGANVSAPSVVIGAVAGASGTVFLNSGNMLAVAQSLVVGAAGSGTLIDDDFGELTVGSTAMAGELDIGADAGGLGLLQVDLAAITVDGLAYVGGSSNGAGGAGTLAIDADGSTPIMSVSGGVTVFGQGAVTLQAGTLAAGSVTIAPGGTVAGDGLVSGLALPNADYYADFDLANYATSAPLTPIIDDGVIEATADPANLAATLPLYGNVSGTGIMAIGAGATLDVEGSVAAGPRVAFDGPDGELVVAEPGNFGAVIDGFAPGDSVRLPGIAPGVVDYDASTGVLTDTAGANVYTFTFDPPVGDFFAASDTHDGTILGFDAPPPCFAAGTMILTDRGEIAVEALRPGDTVVTHRGERRAVRWIGHRRVDISRHRDPSRVRPVRIVAEAIAAGMPRRDLLVSPDHALCLDGMLIVSRLLLNGATIRQEAVSAVTYYHVELDRHDVLLAEGLPAESYLDTGNRRAFENASAPLLHAVFDNDQARREAESCLPFLSEPDRVEPIWRRLASRVAVRGLRLPPVPRTVSDPALCLRVGTRVIRPAYSSGIRYAFVLPRLTEAVRLVSRSVVPARLRPWVEDRRRLGCRVAGLTLREGHDIRTIRPDDPALREGWWDVERDASGMWRWTDGDAVLPLPPGGPSVLEIEVAETLDYPVVTDPAPLSPITPERGETVSLQL